MRKFKNRYFYHIFVSLGDAPGAITLNVVWMEREFDAYNYCLATCAHLTIAVSEIERDIGRKSSFFHTPLHSTPSLGAFPSEYRHPVWYGKARMAWLPDGKKFRIYLYSFWRNSRTCRQTDRRTDTACRHIPCLCIASRGKKNSRSQLTSLTSTLLTYPLIHTIDALRKSSAFCPVEVF